MGVFRNLRHPEKFHPLIISHTHDAFDIADPSSMQNICPHELG